MENDNEMWEILWQFEDLRGSENYRAWSRNAKNALHAMGVFYTCVDPAPIQPLGYTATVDDNGLRTESRKPAAIIKAEQTKWTTANALYKTRSRIARGHIYSKCDDLTQELVEDSIGAFGLWTALKNRYSGQGLGFIFVHSTFQELLHTTLSGCGYDLNKFLATLKGLQRHLKDMDHPIDDWIVCSILLANLDRRFEGYVSRTVSMKECPSFEQIAADLRGLDRMKTIMRAPRYYS